MKTLFSKKIRNEFISKNFGSCSLCDSIQDLIKAFPRNFEISTNNGKYRFNKDLIELLIPIIKEALIENKSLKEYHFDINDEQNVFEKFENLFKGETVEFLNSEEEAVKRITSFFEIGTFPIEMTENKIRCQMTHFVDAGATFPEKIILQIDCQFLANLLKKSPKNFLIKTKQNEYLCNSLGVFASKLISEFLESNPSSTEYYFDFNEDNEEFVPIANFFNWETIQFSPNTVETILAICEKLEITSLMDQLNPFITKMKRTEEIFNENQSIIEPYDELFDKLFNIEEIGAENVADFIEKSEWASTKADVQELAACLLLVAKAKFSAIPHLAELVQALSKGERALICLSPFLVQRLLSSFEEKSNLCAFLYYMSRVNLVATDIIFRKILMNNNSNSLSNIRWFLPEIFERKILSRDQIEKLTNENCNGSKQSDEMLQEAIDRTRLLRDNGGQTDKLIQSIKSDDVNTFQSIVSMSAFDVRKSNIKMTVFDGFQVDEISFIDYSAFCGSLKCFKFLFLAKAPITIITLCYAIQGGNIEIIRILDQNKDSFTYVGFRRNKYIFRRENPIDFSPILTAVQQHCNNVFDWMLENAKNQDEREKNRIFKTAVSVGNAHVIAKLYEDGFDINSIDLQSLHEIIRLACLSGLYRMLLFMSKLFSFGDLFNPHKINFELEKNFGRTKRGFIGKFYSEIMKLSICFGNIKIFDLLFQCFKANYSIVVFKTLIEAIKLGCIDIVKRFLDNKIYELSGFNLSLAIQSSLESGSDELTDYFLNQYKDFPLTNEIMESTCASNNIKIVKSLIQMANEKRISIDFTEPFLKAVSSKSEDLIKLHIERKVNINFKIVFNNFHTVTRDYPDAVIYLLMNMDNPELKDTLIWISFKTAILMNNVEILKFLMTNKYKYEDLLINAAETSNLDFIKAILEINHSAEFINRIGKSGTALFYAVESSSFDKIKESENSIVYNNANPREDRKNRLEKIEKSRNKIIEFLLSQEGIDPSISVDSINTPLVEAVKISNLEAVNLIIDFYGDNIKDQGKQISDALRVINNKQPKIETHINNVGKNETNATQPVNKEQMIYDKLLDCFNRSNDSIKNIANENMQEDDLSSAILGNQFDVVKKLLNNESVNVDQRFNNGNTYLHLAIEGNSDIQIQRLLLNHPRIDINCSNALKETPLVKAVKCGNKEVIELILNHPKFDASLSRLDYAFLLSVKSKDIFMILIKVDSLDVNYKEIETNIESLETPLIKATKIGSFDIIEAIIRHPTFDPKRSCITNCLFIAVQKKNLELFKYLLELNNGDVNVKNMENESLLFSAVSSDHNYEILKMILGSKKFDPFKNDFQNSFLKSNDAETMKILLAYDEEHGSDFLSLENIFNHPKMRYHVGDTFQIYISNAIDFLLRKKGFYDDFPLLCTSVLSKNHRVHQRFFTCTTCGGVQPICENCALVCHKGHEIRDAGGQFSPASSCVCGNNCKCKSISESFHDEMYDTLRKAKKILFNENEDDKDNDNNDVNIEKQDEEVKSMRCTFDMSGFQPILQPIYRCRKCKVDICQTCALRCHNGHPLNYKGIKPNESCLCFDKTDCCCTSRKDVVCSYAFYGKDYVHQNRYKCQTCHTGIN